MHVSTACSALCVQSMSFPGEFEYTTESVMCGLCDSAEKHSRWASSQVIVAATIHIHHHDLLSLLSPKADTHHLMKGRRLSQPRHCYSCCDPQSLIKYDHFYWLHFFWLAEKFVPMKFWSGWRKRTWGWLADQVYPDNVCRNGGSGDDFVNDLLL